MRTRSFDREIAPEVVLDLVDDLAGALARSVQAAQRH
jgi:hypothetical protein